jgi:alkanesulfonate monooxygenase SsuD/methylene tetrahydromethanopterin reductase-like flavin-dependent oxidoreductase (luciferase family)
MSARPFRFGVMATPQDPNRWRATARHAEQLGFANLVMPDGMQLPAPFPSLAIAAAVTERLTVGTFVLAGPLRPPALAAWEAHSMTTLTGGRFELGIGTGHPGVVRDAVERLGRPATTTPERLADVERTVTALRALDGETPTPVLMAAGGPRAMALAARVADTVTLAIEPAAPRAATATAVAALTEACEAAGRAPELAMNVMVVGDDVPAWLAPSLRTDARTLIENDSPVMLRGDASGMADELRRRREELGVSYVIVGAAFMDAIAPVVSALAGR